MNTVSSHPKRVAHYEVIEPLASTGEMRSYRAKDMSSRRTVTLKVLPRDGDDERCASTLLQLRDQARISEGLKHTGIIEVFEYGEDGPLAFIASEFVEGCRLRPQLRIPVKDAASLLVQLLEALEHAHNQRISHLTLRPSRLLLTSKGQLKVTDFGISQLEQPLPAYLSPEQLDGSVPDHRSDLFAAGVLFYEFLTGASPFSGAQTNDLPLARPADLPPSFITICAKALENDPADRYPSARAFRDDVCNACQGAFGAPPSRLVSNETVVSIFLTTLRGNLRKKRTARISHNPPSKPSSSESVSAWDERLLRTVAQELGVFVGPVSIAIIKEAAACTNELDKLYELAAESLATPDERRIFLARRPGSAVMDNGREVPSCSVSVPSASQPLPKIPAPPVSAPKMEAELQPQREVELAEPPDFLQSRAAREVEPRQPRVNAKPAINSGHRPASSTATPAAEFHKGPSRPQDISINTRLEELLGEQPENLAGYLKQKPAEVSDVIHAFAAAADALVARYAERKKFVGLSPKNICFDRLGKATIQDLSSTVLTGSTMDGAVGSMRYAPPEIFVEKSGIEAPAASDIYTLGFIFYEILLGSDLFRATFPSQRSDLDWLRWHADPKSKATPLKQLLPSHPTALSELLESMIAKEPGTRLSDPAVVLSRLRSIAQQSNKTIIAQKPMQHTKKPKATSFRQSKRNIKGITMIALAVVLAVSALFIQRHPELWRHLSQMYHQLRVPSAEEIPQSTQ